MCGVWRRVKRGLQSCLVCLLCYGVFVVVVRWYNFPVHDAVPLNSLSPWILLQQKPPPTNMLNFTNLSVHTSIRSIIFSQKVFNKQLRTWIQLKFWVPMDALYWLVRVHLSLCNGRLVSNLHLKKSSLYLPLPFIHLCSLIWALNSKIVQICSPPSRIHRILIFRLDRRSSSGISLQTYAWRATVPTRMPWGRNQLRSARVLESESSSE